jgi:hypothetical protein
VDTYSRASVDFASVEKYEETLLEYCIVCRMSTIIIHLNKGTFKTGEKIL